MCHLTSFSHFNALNSTKKMIEDELIYFLVKKRMNEITLESLLKKITLE
jgi:hypothetical protein